MSSTSLATPASFSSLSAIGRQMLQLDTSFLSSSSASFLCSSRATSPDSGLSDDTVVEESSPISLDLDDYTFLRLLGTGSWGRVYHVVDKHTMRDLALKLVHKDSISSVHDRLILGEQRVMKDLDDLNGWVVSLLGSTNDSEYFYLFMVRTFVVPHRCSFDMVRISMTGFNT